MARAFLIFVLLMTAPAMVAQPRPLELLSVAVVQRETVWLSDLLPAEASPDTRSTAEKISLGRSPELGSFRVFTRPQLQAETVGKIEIGLPEQVLVLRQGWSLDVERVREALARSAVAKGRNFSQAIVSIPQEIMTAVPGSQLEVTRLARTSDRQFTATVRCRERNACGAFLAEIVPTSDILSRPWKGQGLSRITVPAQAHNSPSLVRPGIPASLVIESDAVRITLRVPPLRRAALGETVRVLDSATHRVLLADVTGECKLRLHAKSESLREEKR